LNIQPSLDTVLDHQGEETHLAIWAELLIDTETPISLYEKLKDGEAYSFLLESAEGGETFGRYSFIGFAPAKTFHFRQGRGAIAGVDGNREVDFTDPLRVLESLLAEYRVRAAPSLPRFLGGAVGGLGYDAVRYFEKTSVPTGNPLDLPEGFFMIAERLVIVDHLKHRVIAVDLVPLSGDRTAAYGRAVARLEEVVERISREGSPPIFSSPSSELPLPTTSSPSTVEEYVSAVEKAKEAIRSGEIFQVVLSRRFTVGMSIPSFEIYRALRALNPSPYMFHLQFGAWALVGASPEVLVRLDDREILLRPIAGTRPRAASRAEDAALEDELLRDEKELAEHRMLLDLGRNDLGRVADVGSVEVERPLHIERYSHVMHIVSDVRARLAPGRSAFDVLRACFPAGTVSGAPKIRAMEIIASLEGAERGFYAGAVGYFDFSGNMDTCIAIRSMLVEQDKIHLQAGAGIVFDSVPEKEHEECLNKAKAALQAIALARATRRSIPRHDTVREAFGPEDTDPDAHDDHR
jgi:anthranilate synthase component 1